MCQFGVVKVFLMIVAGCKQHYCTPKVRLLQGFCEMFDFVLLAKRPQFIVKLGGYYLDAGARTYQTLDFSSGNAASTSHHYTPCGKIEKNRIGLNIGRY